MEKLHKRSDGFSETPSGNFAVFPLRYSGLTSEGMRFFRYVPKFNAGAIQIEWNPDDSALVIIPADIAANMVMLGYARNLTDAEVSQFNDSVDFITIETPDGIETPEPPPVPMIPPAPPVPPVPELPELTGEPKKRGRPPANNVATTDAE